MSATAEQSSPARQESGPGSRPEPHWRRPLSAGGDATAQPSGRRRQRSFFARHTESLLVFGIGFTIYALLGWLVVYELNVVVLDSLSRLAHAYFAIYNDPPKLAAIGFEWPPIMTLVFLPFASIKPLATSFMALPLTSAVFGGLLLAVLNNTLGRMDAPRKWRWSIVALFGLNPIVAFYASNGMAEVVYLMFLVLALNFFIRWYKDGGSHNLGISGVALAMGTLSRYEVGIYAIALGIGALLVLAQRRATRQEYDGSLVMFGAPLVYGLGAWLFFNLLIVGDALFWLERQAEKNVTVGRGLEGKENLEQIPITEIFADVIDVNIKLFPLTLVAIVVLLIYAAYKRDLMSLILAGVASLNGVMTMVFIYSARDESLLQLRYNMRAMPIVLIGLGWMAYMARDRLHRNAFYAIAVVGLAISAPFTWNAMKTYPYQFQEQAFVRALETLEDQEGTTSIGNYRIGVANQRDMADFINANISKPNSILTDDESQTYGVMLAGGRPDLFVDRIDRGDDAWTPIVRAPWGKVNYFLVSTFPTDPERIRTCYPGLIDDQVPGTKEVHRNPGFALYRVAPEIPKPLIGKELPGDCPTV